MYCRFSPSLVVIVAILLSQCGINILCAAEAELDAKLSEDGKKVTVTVDGKLFAEYLPNHGKMFAEYLKKSGSKPIIWPIIGPTGKRMTREYPMAEAGKHEQTDHLHQSSLWFTHGNVNGVDFWAEPKSIWRRSKDEDVGEIRHREFVKIEGGKTATIVTRNDWRRIIAGTRICEDETKITFGADDDTRWIDYDITIKACDKPVTFADTKEGCFGIRIAAPLTPDAKMGAVLINSEGHKNENAWGKSARWVDYSGEIDGDKLGITMMNHPSSFRYPTYWHVRTSGLCAANPFGLGHFVGNDKNGAYTIPVGGSITLCYRVLFHKDNTKLEEAFEAYKATAK